MDDEVKEVFGSNASEICDLRRLVRIVRGRLYLATFSNHRFHQDTKTTHFFSFGSRRKILDGIVDLGQLTEYIDKLNGIMFSSQYASKIVVQYSTDDFRESTEAALLIGTYAVAVRKLCPRFMYSVLKHCDQCDDENLISGYNANHIDLYGCLSAINKAVKYKLVDFNDFNCNSFYGSHGLTTWIVPDKLIAFRGPIDGNYDMFNKPQYYSRYFQNNNVKTIVRLNRVQYDKSWFTQVGMDHRDLYFPDGTAPSNFILEEFLRICEQTPGAVAVHCKAGLGRTGTLIAAYIIQHYKMTAREAIAWLRLCRPGSVMGPQQSFLVDKQDGLWRKGDALRKKNFGHLSQMPYCARGIYSNVNINIQKEPLVNYNCSAANNGNRYENGMTLHSTGKAF